MDAEKFGAFISQCRKEKQMTQAELAARLQVTDKAVSRWERGIGFPDISTILGILAVLLLLFLWMDHMQWQLDTILFTGIGVVFPPLLSLWLPGASGLWDPTETKGTALWPDSCRRTWTFPPVDPVFRTVLPGGRRRDRTGACVK